MSAVAEVDAAGAPFEPKGGVFGFFLMVIGMFMAILDIQIVASSLPQIQTGVSASLDEVTWVQTAYLVAEVVMIPLSGWLARVMSSRWLYTVCSIGFTLMSALCAMSWSIESLIFFRVLQGFIGGGMIPTVFAAIFKLLPQEKQMVGSVVIGLTATVAPAIGPTLGGYITEYFSWHWLFLINVVPGLIVSIAVPLTVNFDQAEPGLLRKIDLIGIVLIGTSLGSLEFVLDEGPRNDWFADEYILIFTIVSAVSFVWLIWRELTHEHPVLELHAFANRNFAAGCVLTFVLGSCMYGQSFILPQVLSQIRDFNSLQVGEVMFVTGAAMFCTAPISGRLANSLDPRRLLLAGFVLVALGLYLNSLMTTEVGFDQLVLPQVLRGSGLMLSMVPITAVALGTLPKELVSGGSGLFNVFRNMGGAVGLSMINTQWDGRYDRHYWWLVEKLSSTDPKVTSYLRQLKSVFSHNLKIGNADHAAYYTLIRQVGVQANIMAWNDVFFMMALAFVCCLPLAFLFSRPQQAPAGAH